MLSVEPPYMSPTCRLHGFLSVSGAAGAPARAITIAHSPHVAWQPVPRPSQAPPLRAQTKKEVTTKSAAGRPVRAANRQQFPCT